MVKKLSDTDVELADDTESVDDSETTESSMSAANQKSFGNELIEKRRPGKSRSTSRRANDLWRTKHSVAITTRACGTTVGTDPPSIPIVRKPSDRTAEVP